MKLSKIAIATMALSAIAFAQPTDGYDGADGYDTETSDMGQMSSISSFLSSNQPTPNGGIKLPIDQGKMAVTGNIAYITASKSYDADGKSHDMGDDLSLMGPVVGFKYGVISNLEASAFLSFVRASGGDSEMGLGTPVIQAKYGMKDLGVAGIVAINLPFGDEDIFGEDQILTYDLGAIVERKMDKMVLAGALLYHWIPENDDKLDAGNTISVDLLPGYEIQQGLIGKLDIRYDMTAKSAFDGTDFGDGASLLSVAPGASFQLNEKTELEAFIPITVLGESNVSYWGIRLGATMSL